MRGENAGSFGAQEAKTLAHRRRPACRRLAHADLSLSELRMPWAFPTKVT